MRFTKMQGLGNDYLYIYGQTPENIEALSIRLSDRHFGAGSDGIIVISPCETADFQMRIFNADGSEAAMCGNGIRCVGKYVYEKGYTDKTHLRIDTRSGIKQLDLHLTGKTVRTVTVNMGKAKADAPLPITVEETDLSLIPVSVGNPHAVIFVPDIGAAPLTTFGPKIERHPAFPDRVNVEFVQVLSDHELRMRVWERGSGVTMACGTGACAAAMAAIACGHCGYDRDLSVQLDGGTLTIRIAPDHTVRMTGPAAFVYEGETSA